jgi:uncharacterized membrane protein YagU involved in acid resistance
VVPDGFVVAATAVVDDGVVFVDDVAVAVFVVIVDVDVNVFVVVVDVEFNVFVVVVFVVVAAAMGPSRKSKLPDALVVRIALVELVVALLDVLEADA